MSSRTLGLLSLLLALASSPASAQVGIQSSLRVAIEACLKQAVVSLPMQLKKSRISGSAETSLDIWCNGEPARQLFDVMAPYSKQSGPDKDDRNSTYLLRYFGDSETQCVRTIVDATGAPTDSFTCYFGLHVGDKALAAM